MPKNDPPVAGEGGGGARAPQPAAQQLLTPLEWAKRKKLITPRNPRFPQSVEVAHWQHSTAAQLHGWTEDAHHYQGAQALRLSERDYDAALEAAAKFPTVPPHGPALSRVVAERFENFKPKKPRDRKPAQERSR